MKMRRGISPIIATVIIVAVAIAIAVAVVGWLTGLWTSISGGTGSLKVYPDSYINVSSKILVLHVKNEGTGKVTIYKLSIGGFGDVAPFSTTTSTPSSMGQVYVVTATPSGSCFVDSVAGTIVVKANGECVLQIGLNPDWAFASSGSYSVTIYTKEAGTVPYAAPVRT